MSSAPEPLRRIATILDALGGASEGLTSGKLAVATGLPMPTLHRTLRNLIAIGYVNQAAPGMPFKIGQRLLDIVQPRLRWSDIAPLIEPLLQRLADQLGCVTGLTAATASQTTETIIEVLPKKRGSALVLAGHGFPPHCTATGKLALARLSDAELSKFVARGLEACRPATIVDPAKLQEHLAAVRARGYATCHDECDPGVHSIAVPLEINGYSQLATLGAVGLETTLLKNRTEEEVAEVLKVAAQEIVARLSGLESASPSARKGGDARRAA